MYSSLIFKAIMAFVLETVGYVMLWYYFGWKMFLAIFILMWSRNLINKIDKISKS